MHGKDALPVSDDRLTLTGQKTSYEYDGLESGELAWVLGHQFPIKGEYYPQAIQYAALATMPLKPPNPATGGSQAYPESVGMGPIGHGVDRLQRLAYTNWIESHFSLRAGRQVINLKTAEVADQTGKAISSLVKQYSDNGLGGLDLFGMPDIAYALQELPTNVSSSKELQVTRPMVQGLFAMERGPFLRSIGTDHRAVSIKADKVANPLTGATEPIVKPCVVNRHLGSDIAQAALESILKQNGVFNWTPDGICMSKYETGPDGIADAEFDARMSQLYNVAVAGSAITKTWTGDDKLVCLPTDKVFILVVGDLSYSTKDVDNTTSAAATKTNTMVKAFWKFDSKTSKVVGNKAATDAEMDLITDAPINPKPVEDVANAPGSEAAFNAWIGKVGDAWSDAELANTPDVAPAAGKRDGIRGYEQALNEPSADPDAKAAKVSKYKARADYLWSQFKATGGGDTAEVDKLLSDFDKDAAKLRNGKRSVASAKLTNLRLMRATSSYLISHSHYRTSADGKMSANSRLGLPIKYDKDKKAGVASYVLGGWCIGTVLDSAASRTMSGSVVRVSASSMAININVNVEWWNADKLYQKYQDKERYVKSTSNLMGKIPDANKPKVKTPIDAETYAPFAEAANSKPAGTMKQRDIAREPPSYKYSLDRDVEDYDEVLRTSEKEFSRVWEMAEVEAKAKAAAAAAAAAPAPGP
jgi:hypothetical protein